MNSVIEQIWDLSRAVNWSYNINDNKAFNSLTIKLFQTVQGVNCQILTELPINDYQPVGLAFARMALYGEYNNGDKDINSVAAENAYYCLAKSFLVKQNVYTLPAIFRLLNDDKTLLADKLIASWISMCEQELKIPIKIALGGNPYKDPRLIDFRNQALEFSYCIRYYVLCNFYLPDSKQLCIPDDLFLLQPSNDEIDRFISENKDSDIMDLIMSGENHFKSVFLECEKTLEHIKNKTGSCNSIKKDDGKNELIITEKMSLRELIIKENAKFQEVVNPQTGKHFFICGSKRGYISPNAQKLLADPSATMDDFLFAMVAKPGEEPIPCLMVIGNGKFKHIRTFGYKAAIVNNSPESFDDSFDDLPF